MITIHLKDLQFHAHHGFYEEEKILGNTFIVNLHVHYLPVLPVLHDIKQVVNYERLFELTKQRMGLPAPLLETVAMELCHTVMQHFEQVHAVFVSIEKTNPPIPSLQGSVLVAYQLSKEPDHLN